MKNDFLFFAVITACVFFISCGKISQTSEKNNDSIVLENEETAVNIVELKANSPAEIYAKRQVPVLCYHRIEYGRNDEYTVTPATFEAHMKVLADSGFHSINPDQYYNYLVYNEELPEKPVMITFDDSRIEHYTIGAKVIEKYGFKGVFFIMTITYNKKNYMSTDQIAELAKNGHTIGFHSWDHTRATKYDNDSILRKNVVEPKKKLEEIIGMPVDYFAYPYGLTNESITAQMNDHFKMSFILSTKQDSINPIQSVRRMIAPEWKPQSLLRAMEKTFSRR
ncbi:MAG: polysaccharide deacetylase family protein [Bacteroidales bacterium]|nr:polysaccharide deacetylase family protein [Bacteroidales bacterium]